MGVETSNTAMFTIDSAMELLVKKWPKLTEPELSMWRNRGSDAILAAIGYTEAQEAKAAKAEAAAEVKAEKAEAAAEAKAEKEEAKNVAATERMAKQDK